jgi:hypothetical protein
MLSLDMRLDERPVVAKLRQINRIFTGNEPHMARAMNAVGLHVQAVAENNAPRSPSTSQYRRQLKTAKGRKNSTFKGTPGGLERAIEHQVHGSEYVDILVPINSRAGKYAAKMHDEKGSTWNELGPGSRAKGGQVGDKYILRAIESEEDANARELERALGLVIED